MTGGKGRIGAGGWVGLLIACLALAEAITWSPPRRATAAEGKVGPVPAAAPGKQLVQNLGCPVCHTLDGHTTTVQEDAPDLTWEGDKVRPGWLFTFLQKPHDLRPAIRARMPNFRLSDREILAVTRYVISLKNPKAPALAEAFRYRGEPPAGRIAEGKVQLKALKCQQCHALGGRLVAGADTGDVGPSLEVAAQRLEPDWIIHWLKDPQVLQPETKMPNFFYSDGDPLMDNPDPKILALRDYLVSLAPPASPAAYEAAKRQFPDVTAEEGRRLMQELNCRGCHKIPGLPEGKKIAPVLSYAGSKFQQEWLTGFLKSPHTIRSAGYILGWRSRMPTFRLSDEEAKAIADYLMTLTYPGLTQGIVKEEKTLTRFESFQARKLFEKSEGCIGCHRVKNGRGEAVGGLSAPDLSEAGKRLQGDFIYHFIRSPRAFEPQGKMEIFGDFLSDKDGKVLAEYLSTLK